MVSIGRAFVSGVVLWFITFATAFAVFPLRESNRPLFESIMPVVLALGTVLLAHRYFRKVSEQFAREGLLLGLLWLGVNVAIDLPLMLPPSPMQMTLSEYLADIGVTYLLIPVITTGMGWSRAEKDPGSGQGVA